MSKLAVLSTAHIHTRGFLDNIKNAKDGRLLHAVWDDVPERGEVYAREYGAPFVDDLAEVVADPEVDGFVICAENTRHLPLLEAALPTGKPVFCEKPLVTTAKDLKKVKALLASHGSTLILGYFLPFSADMRAVGGLLREKDGLAPFFGKITRVRCRNAHHAAYGRWFDHPDLQWFHNPELSGGGAFMDMGTHAIHLLRTLFGPVTEVWAEIANHSAQYPGTDDFGIAHLRFANGLLGTVEAGWTQTGGIGGLEIVGSEKTLFHDGKDYQISGPGFPQEPLYRVDAAQTRIDRLVSAIRGLVPAEDLAADLEAAIDAVAIMEACYSSAAKGGRWTKLPKT